MQNIDELFMQLHRRVRVEPLNEPTTETERWAQLAAQWNMEGEQNSPNIDAETYNPDCRTEIVRANFCRVQGGPTKRTVQPHHVWRKGSTVPRLGKTISTNRNDD